MTLEDAKQFVAKEVMDFENKLYKAKISRYDNERNFLLDCQRLMDELRLKVDREILLGLSMANSSLEDYLIATKPLIQCQHNLVKQIKQELKIN